MALYIWFDFIIAKDYLLDGWPQTQSEYLILLATYFLGAAIMMFWVGLSHFKDFNIYVPLVVFSVVELLYWLGSSVDNIAAEVFKIILFIVVVGVPLFVFWPELKRRLEKLNVIDAFGIRLEFPSEGEGGGKQLATLPLTSFKDLMAALSDMLGNIETGQRDNVEKIRITAYTPALGYLAREKTEWKKLKNLLDEHAQHIEMTSLKFPIGAETMDGASDLERWHKNFEDRITNRGSIEGKDITQANELSREIINNVNGGRAAEGDWVGLEYSKMPKYYLFASESRAILVVPFNEPGVGESKEKGAADEPKGKDDTDESKGKGAAGEPKEGIQMVGLVTGNKKIIKMIKDVHDDYRRSNEKDKKDKKDKQ